MSCSLNSLKGVIYGLGFRVWGLNSLEGGYVGFRVWGLNALKGVI